ncbi:MAG: hypothetical protein H3C54_08070 [Taibaiella sp.]|nr:hypothetical protein [Taibaiella sp.]
MKAHYLLLLILCISFNSNGQINAIEEDSILDRYYINYPIDTGAEYHIGDTVAAVYYSPETYTEELVHLVFRTLPTGKHKPVHVVRAVITDVYQDSTRTYQYISGLKLKVFSIERHYKGGVTYPDEYVKSDNCPIVKHTEKWYDVRDWQNTSGLYRIRRFTDNYAIGDTVYRMYLTEKSLLGGLFGTGRVKLYYLSAVVKDMDTTERQALLLEITSIEESITDDMLYNYVNIHKGDLVWTKPYRWLKAGQHKQVNDGKTIPGGTRIVIGCQGTRFQLYDCEGNRYTF